jgi:hypothetical protein
MVVPRHDLSRDRMPRAAKNVRERWAPAAVVREKAEIPDAITGSHAAASWFARR